MTIEERYADDIELLEYYQKNLLEPGWPGDLDEMELTYIKSKLRESASLRRRWGFKPSAKRLSDKHIRLIAYGLSAIR